MRIHRTTGDSLRTVPFEITQNTDRGIQPRDLADSPVLATIYDSQGNVVIPETTTGVTVVDAATGQVTYDFPHGAAALPAGTFRLYFVIYGGAGFDPHRFDVWPLPPGVEVVVTDR